MPHKDPVERAAYRKRWYLENIKGPTKVCIRCGEEKPNEDFRKKNDRPSQRFRRSSYCHPCRAEVHKDYQLRKVFGISRAEFEAMVERQGNMCAICGGPPDAKKKYLCVDHDHYTGSNRGLLCVRCNALVGNALENPVLLEIASAYLASFSTNEGSAPPTL